MAPHFVVELFNLGSDGWQTLPASAGYVDSGCGFGTAARPALVELTELANANKDAAADVSVQEIVA